MEMQKLINIIALGLIVGIAFEYISYLVWGPNKYHIFFPNIDDISYTLYRNSEAFPDMRIHIATFNSDENKSYNEENCYIAASLFKKQTNVVKYWCEEGNFKK